ncbi:hypothetical protein TRVL_05014 [Trypanosoma vivax]|nr:hypothetical protein TRVL_05014 [Trypanosoma vivax]
MVSCIDCRICPTSRVITLPGPSSVLEVKKHLSAIIGVAADCIELYINTGQKLASASPESHSNFYYVLLRLCGGKGGFRKQLEKKGRAFARARRLRKSANSASNQQAKKVIKVQEKSDKHADATDADAAHPHEEDSISVMNLLDVGIRDAVSAGIKKVVTELSEKK